MKKKVEVFVTGLNFAQDNQVHATSLKRNFAKYLMTGCLKIN